MFLVLPATTYAKFKHSQGLAAYTGVPALDAQGQLLAVDASFFVTKTTLPA